MTGTYWTDNGVKNYRPDWDNLRTALRRRSAGKCEQRRLNPGDQPCHAHGIDVSLIRHEGPADPGNAVWLCSAHRRQHASL